MAGFSGDGHKPAGEFRDFGAEESPSVRNLYRMNHARQTLDFVLSKKSEFLPPSRRAMGVWDALEDLGDLDGDSDPELPPIDHALQTAEALRAADKPDWMILTGLVHDLGKVLHLFDEPQWAVVGDTFPVGCAFSPKVVFHELFKPNPDLRVAEFCTENGIYDEGCGLDRVHFSWGHDEYLHGVMQEHLPEEALYVIRFHSFHAGHTAGAYEHLMNERDRRLLPLVREFSQFDLYAKAKPRLRLRELRGYYEELVARFLPDSLAW